MNHGHVHIACPDPDLLRNRVTTQDGVEIRGIRSIELKIKPNEIVTARLEILSAFVGSADATYVLSHPLTGELTEVTKIEFADGDVWPPVEPESPHEWLIGAFRGADGIIGPPPPMVPFEYVDPKTKKYVGPPPPHGWTYAKDGYSFLCLQKPINDPAAVPVAEVAK